MSTVLAPPADASPAAKPSERIRVGFVMHVMQVAGAEMLVARLIRDLQSLIEPTIFCLDGVGELGETLQGEGVEVMSLNRRPGRDWGLVKRLAQEVRTHNIQVLHAHQYTPFFYAALAKLWGARSVRLMFTEHGRHYPDEVSRLRRFGNSWLLSFIPDRINACCEFSAAALRSRDGFGRRAVDVVYNGIDPDEFTPTGDRRQLRSQLGLDPARRYIVNVARFHPVKDHETLVKAFRAVAERLADVDLLLVGDGPRRPQIEALVAEYQLAGRVRFLGVRADVSAILQASDAFVLSSVSEAASLTLLEAMASECPVVATDVGGNSELVRPNLDGLLTPRADAAGMADALLELLTDPSRADALARSARERVCSRFQQRQTVDRFARLYVELSRSAPVVSAT
jgi:glycosyltransferase involved in cell wall biosynthesis